VAAETPEEAAKRARRRRELYLWARDFGLALLILVGVLGSLFLYSGLWPPIVVVESTSMQHSDTRSAIGIVDAGDIMVVKKTTSAAQVVTYLGGLATGHRTYGEPGDVIIYAPDGNTAVTPIIHRALVYLELNTTTGNSFDIPELSLLPPAQWRLVLPESSQRWWNLSTTVQIDDIGYLGVTLELPLSELLARMAREGITPHGGFLTGGDHNLAQVGAGRIARPDQLTLFGVTEPVKEEWIVGRARGEIPWFGLLKLWAGGDLPASTPDNSIRNVWLSIAAIILVPLAADLTISRWRVSRARAKSAPVPAAAETPRPDEGPAEGTAETEPGPPPPT